MRKSQTKLTPEKSRTLSKSRQVPLNSASRVHSQIYYCHYKNAMYMGGMKSFKKEGRGILLHDNGLSVITSYYNDVLHGHNIFFDNYGLLSAIYNKNKVAEAAYRTEGFLIFLNYTQDKQLDGTIKLINFITKSVTYSLFKKGSMIDKTQETDINLLNRIFQMGQLELIIGRAHSKIFKYQFQKIPYIEIQKQGNKIVIGFEKQGYINGLGFHFVYRSSKGGYNPDTHRNEDDFQLRVVERGYYINTQLNGMGFKIFKNGNLYIGEFKNGLFEGNGILKNNDKHNWVSGYFKNGNLVQLLEYNNKDQTKTTDKIIQALHQRKTNWINNQISLVQFNFFVEQIQKIISTAPNKQVQSLEQRKQEVLKKIQEKFIADNNQSFSQEIEGSIHQLRNNSAGNSSISKFIPASSPAPTGPYRRLFINTSDDSNRKLSSKDPSIPFGSSRDQSQQFGVIKEENSRVQADFPQRRSKSNISKVKIFERSSTHKSPVKVDKDHDHEINKKFVHSPGWIKGNDQLSSSRRTESMHNEQREPPRQTNNKVWHPLTKSEFTNSRFSREQLPMGASFEPSSEQISFSNKGVLDSKRMIAKNKIFKYLQSQQQKHQSPQFNQESKREIGVESNLNKSQSFRRTPTVSYK